MPSPLLFRLNILLYTKVFANLFTIHKQSKQKKERKKKKSLTIIEKRRKNALSVDFFFLSLLEKECSLQFEVKKRYVGVLTFKFIKALTFSMPA